MPFAPGRKFGNRPRISFPGIRVSNVGGEEFDEPFGRVGRRGEKGGEFFCGWYGELDGGFHICPLSNNTV